MKIKSEKPALVVGNGPSYKQYMEDIRNFPAIKLVVDSSFKDCMEAGVDVDYLITRESTKRRIAMEMMPPELLKDFKGRIIGSTITRPDTIDYFNEIKADFVKMRPDENEERASNVGIFAMKYAYEELNADRIFIIGMEHEGSKYEDIVYRTWQTDFWYFVKKWPKGTVINCTNGGALYFKDFIIRSTLGEIEIENGNNNTGEAEQHQTTKKGTPKVLQYISDRLCGR